jgi:hypothetical protein
MGFIVLIAACAVILIGIFVIDVFKIRKSGICSPVSQILSARSHGLKSEIIIKVINTSKVYEIELSIPFLVLMKSESIEFDELLEALKTQDDHGRHGDLFLALETIISVSGEQPEAAESKAFELYKWNCCYIGSDIPKSISECYR